MYKSLRDEQASPEAIPSIIGSILLDLKSKIGENCFFVLVEGESDKKVYSKFFYSNFVRFEVCKGNKNLQDILKICNTDPEIKNKAIGIKDADFSHLLNEKPTFDNLFFTDSHDLEMTMLKCDATRQNLFHEFRTDDCEIDFQEILAQMAFVGYVQFYNFHLDKGFNIKVLSFQEFVSPIDCKFELDRDKFLKQLEEKTKKEVDIAELDNFISEHLTEDYYNLCNGHNICSVIALSTSNPKRKREFVEATLRPAYRLSDFIETTLYKDIKKWQEKNKIELLLSA
jgi:hypothetical protein